MAQPFSLTYTIARRPPGTKGMDSELHMGNPLYNKDIKKGFYKEGGKLDLAVDKAIRRAVKGNRRGEPGEDGLCAIQGPLVGWYPTGEGHYLLIVIIFIESTQTVGKAKANGKHVVALVDENGNLWLYPSPNPLGLLEPLPGQKDVKQKRADLIALLVADGDELVPLWKWLGFKQKPLVSAVLSRISWPDMKKYQLPEMTGVLGYSNALNYHSPNKKKNSASRSASPVRQEDKVKKSKSKSKEKSKEKKAEKRKEKKAEKKEKKERRRAEKKAAASLEERASAVAAEKAKLEAQLAELEKHLALIAHA